MTATEDGHGGDGPGSGSDGGTDGGGSGGDSGGDGGDSGGDSGGDKGGDSGGDGGTTTTTDDVCEDEYHRLTGAWDWESTFPLDDALDGFFEFLLDAGDELCTLAGTGAITGVPTWLGDVFCVLEDLDQLMQNMEVEHSVLLTEIGNKQWEVNEDWKWVTFDPGGINLRIDPDTMDCPFEPETYLATYTCDSHIALQNHDVDVPVNGVLNIFLDGVACGAMGGMTGCSWDRALDIACDDIDNLVAQLTCLTLVSELALPDPCVEFVDFEAEANPEVSWSTPLTISGVWEGEVAGDDFTGPLNGQHR